MLHLPDEDRHSLAELNRDATKDAMAASEDPHTAWLGALVDRLIDVLLAGGLADPLAAVLADLCALAGAEMPAAIAERIGLCSPCTRRGRAG